MLQETSYLKDVGLSISQRIKAITALKKGSQLLKYGRRGKPKFCPFRLSNPIFQRYPRPEKEYQSFSLIYDDRSLDLICKDKDEAEVWFTGLKALISRAFNRRGEQKQKVELPLKQIVQDHTRKEVLL